MSGEQEQEPQPQSGEEFDVAGVSEPQHVRPDQHTADDQEQHLRRAARHQAGNDRCQRGDGHDQQQRAKRTRAHRCAHLSPMEIGLCIAANPSALLPPKAHRSLIGRTTGVVDQSSITRSAMSGPAGRATAR